ncbi:N5-carboxyaminoimidazole ribonucleotide mutase [archaeon]|nr:N5-carboxyaminoimidazole ribonucleotide mutase [archaeon]
MNIIEILRRFKEDKIGIHEAEKQIKLFEISRIGDFGVVDITRENRAGIPEVVYGENKSKEQLNRIVDDILKNNGRCIITKLNEDKIDLIELGFEKRYIVEVFRDAGVVVIKDKDFRLLSGGKIAVISAGTSDVPVAREAEVMAREMGCEVYSYFDIGVAGIHRLFPAIRDIIENDVDSVVVAAGMEGALPSVVAGLIDIPVIGLPVSSGYGFHGKGETALFSMLQSCSPGLSVMNIDNGFGAGVFAALVANRVEKFRKESGLQ